MHHYDLSMTYISGKVSEKPVYFLKVLFTIFKVPLTLECFEWAKYSTIEKSSQKKKKNRIAELLISIKEILNGKLHLFVQCNGQNCKTWRKCYVLYYDKLTSYLKSSLCSHVRATDPKMVQEIIAKSTSEERHICSSWFWHLICENVF